MTRLEDVRAGLSGACATPYSDALALTAVPLEVRAVLCRLYTHTPGMGVLQYLHLPSVMWTSPTW